MDEAAQGFMTVDSAAAVKLAIARDWFPGRPTVATLRNWSSVGLLDPNGNRVRLQTIRLGGCRFTTRTWAEAFLKAVATHSVPEAIAAEITDERRISRAEEARRQLVAMGFYGPTKRRNNNS